MGKRHRRAHVASYIILMMHLLKWQFQAERRSRSWLTSIDRERLNIAERETESTDLQKLAEAGLDHIFQQALRRAAAETRLPLSTFPETCPYTANQLRDRDYLPE
tara:strand:+ start:1230 stop:1544 length:315 start_codon:yes stop_codon:yes gene_type:complete